RAAEQRDELAPFHQQFLPCFEAEDSTAGDLLHCGISKKPLSAVGHFRRFGVLPTHAASASLRKRTNCTPFRQVSFAHKRRFRSDPLPIVTRASVWVHYTVPFKAKSKISKFRKRRFLLIAR